MTTCPTGCGRPVKPGHLMCYRCWREVPQHLRAEVWRAWRAFDGHGTDEQWEAYLAAREAAIGAVP